MTTAEQSSEDLPLLTRVIEETPDDLPTLTQIVGEISPTVPQGETLTAAEDDLPVLMETVASGLPDAPEAKAAEDDTPALSEASLEVLTQRLEAQIESVFAQKLGHRLEQLQRLAVDQAISELKAELPQMLRDALHSPNTTR